MTEQTDRAGNQFDLAEANFSAELCPDAARFLRSAMKNREAYLINDALVFKFMSTQEAFGLGVYAANMPQDAGYYGLRVGLCIKDVPPFRKGQWYTTSNEEVRRQILDAVIDSKRNIHVPILNDQWKVIRRVSRLNRSQDLLDEATSYAKTVRESTSSLG